MEVFLDKEVSEAVPDKEGKRALWRNKKARDFMHFLIHKSTLLSAVEIYLCDCGGGSGIGGSTGTATAAGVAVCGLLSVG